MGRFLQVHGQSLSTAVVVLYNGPGACNSLRAWDQCAAGPRETATRRSFECRPVWTIEVWEKPLRAL
jgi:hypothetical protein